MKLGVNVDHIATLRQARKARVPDPVEAAMSAELAGADGITVHLRSDRRHIQERDLHLLRQIIKTKLNLEMAVTPEMTKVAAGISPDTITLVPERPEELTTEGGLNIVSSFSDVKTLLSALAGKGIKIGAFIDTGKEQVDAAYELKLSHVEINTGKYADAVNEDEKLVELDKIKTIVNYAVKKGITVNGGHGLDYKNVCSIAGIHDIYELNIGHSIIARSVIVGMYEAVAEMLLAINDR